LIWYLEDSTLLSKAAREIYDSSDRGDIAVHVPTICLVEIIYLQEKGRIPPDLKARLDAELQADSTGLVLACLTAEVADALSQVPRGQVPDMPDRIIAATALSLGLPLISRDRRIQVSEVETLW
jgi:PIN domain nuclease of toxin-antitoxin system